MADLKSKHAFGSEANVESALEQGLINEFDILFLDEEKIGWIDKNKNVIIPERGVGEEVVNSKIEVAKQEMENIAKAYTDEKLANVSSHDVVEF